MRKYTFFIIAILALVIFVSGCTGGTNTYSGNGVSFNYPASWQQLQIPSQNTVAGFGDPNSVDNSTGSVNTLVLVQKAVLPNGKSLKQVYDDSYAQLAAGNTSFQPISDTTTTVDGKTAYVNTHTVNVMGVQKKEKTVWFEKNGNVYTIICGSLPADFEGQQANFDMIINSFKVQ